MPSPTFNFPKMRAARFEGFSRKDLDKAALIAIGQPFAANVTEEAAIALLCNACNIPRATGAEPQVPPEERNPAPLPNTPSATVVKMPIIGKLGRIPNLSSTGRWEGRRRRVQLARANNPEGTIALGWDGRQKWVIRTPDIVDMPWPYWVMIRDAKLVDTLSDNVRTYERNKKTKQLEVVTEPTSTPLYQYMDMLDVPGTEDLPTSYFDYFRTQALGNECFKGYPRNALILVYTKLRDNPGSTFFEKKDNVEIRQKIAEVLGPELVEMLSEEVYAEVG